MGSQTWMGSHSLSLVHFTLSEWPSEDKSQLAGSERLSGAKTDIPIRVRRPDIPIRKQSDDEIGSRREMTL